MSKNVLSAIVAFIIIFAGLTLRSFIYDTIFKKEGSFIKNLKFNLTLAIVGAIIFFAFENR